MPHLLVQVPSFSYSFQQKSCQIIGFFLNLRSWWHRLGNPESTTAIGTERTLNRPGINQTEKSKARGTREQNKT